MSIEAPIRLALFEPDIAPNVAAILRTCACIGVAVDLIRPFGFVWSDKKLRRVGMDYLEFVDLTIHDSWETFRTFYPEQRRVLLSTRAVKEYDTFRFRKGDIVLCGRETAGVPNFVHTSVDARLVIPMVENVRSLNVSMSAAMVLGEGLRQLGAFPKGRREPQ